MLPHRSTVRCAMLAVAVPSALAGMGWLLGPAVIELLYTSEWPVVGDLLDGRSLHSREHYVALWRSGVLRAAVAAVVCATVATLLFRGWRDGRSACERLVTPATAGTLGAIRMLAAGALLWCVAWEDLPGTARHAGAALQPSPLVSLAPIAWLAQSETALRVLEWATIAVLVGAMVGWRTRLMLALSIAAYFLVGALLRQYSHFFHQGLVPWYLLVILLATPSGDGWSVDRLSRLARGGTVVPSAPSRAYGWGRFGCWAILAVVYLAAALSKLKIGGLDWWDGDNLRWIVYHDTLNSTEFRWTWATALADQPDGLFAALGLSALTLELLYPLVLVSRRGRVWLPTGVAAMHGGIYLLQNVLFFDLILLQLIFMDGTALRRAIAARWRRTAGRIEILYDGDCPLCRRTIAVLRALDLFDRLACVNFRGLDLDAYNAGRRLTLTLADLDREMYVVDACGARTGFDGYRRLAWDVPALWLLLSVLYLPGVAWLGRGLYRYIARERLRLVRCDESCARDVAVPAAVLQPAAGLLPVCLLYAVIVLSFCAGFFGVEAYPVTAYPMYAERHGGGHLQHYQLIARDVSGRRAEVDLNRYLGPFRHNRLRDVLYACFVPERAGRCETHLRAVGRRYNAAVNEGSALAALQVQQWGWDYRRHPTDTRHGDLVAVRTILLSDSAAPQAGRTAQAR